MASHGSGQQEQEQHPRGSPRPPKGRFGAKNTQKGLSTMIISVRSRKFSENEEDEMLQVVTFVGDGGSVGWSLF